MPGDGSVGALALGVPWAARHRAHGGLRFALPSRADFGLRDGFCAAICLWRVEDAAATTDEARTRLRRSALVSYRPLARILVVVDAAQRALSLSGGSADGRIAI